LSPSFQQKPKFACGVTDNFGFSFAKIRNCGTVGPIVGPALPSSDGQWRKKEKDKDFFGSRSRQTIENAQFGSQSKEIKAFFLARIWFCFGRFVAVGCGF
jgi:hypothetical protein